jgi:hypothetical protein
MVMAFRANFERLYHLVGVYDGGLRIEHFSEVSAILAMAICAQR